MKKVAVGLSGGVDSSVSAALLKEQGLDVTGVYITCWSGPGCRSEDDRQDALDIALQLGIPFEHLDFQQAYKDKVYEYMLAEYNDGRTPNPDIICNREIKFGLFYNWAMSNGFDCIATGHYAQTDGENLLQSVDSHKDQTYFLYQLKQDQLRHILFPIGSMTKHHVRQEAENRGLLTAQKADSVGICFIGEVPMDKFLSERILSKPGNIIINNQIVGTHKGINFYTIGQRIAIAQTKQLEKLGFDPTNLPHFYVTEKNISQNLLTIGLEKDLYQSQITLTDLHWINSPPSTENLSIRIRHTGELIKIESIRTEDQRLITKLAAPVRAPAPGQSAVIYQDTICLGGGIMS